MIDLVEVQEGYAEALAAALGDDLVGGLDPATPVHWLEHAAERDAPALPPGCVPLDQFVAGPPALARRLAQIGVAEPAVASGLQTKLLQGQRLVSRDGGLWRWDGFVRLPDAAGPGATRLRQRARLRQLEAEGTEQAAALAARREELAASRGGGGPGAGRARAGGGAARAPRPPSWRRRAMLRPRRARPMPGSPPSWQRWPRRLCASSRS